MPDSSYTGGSYNAGYGSASRTGVSSGTTTTKSYSGGGGSGSSSYNARETSAYSRPSSTSNVGSNRSTVGSSVTSGRSTTSNIGSAASSQRNSMGRSSLTTGAVQAGNAAARASGALNAGLGRSTAPTGLATNSRFSFGPSVRDDRAPSVAQQAVTANAVRNYVSPDVSYQMRFNPGTTRNIDRIVGAKVVGMNPGVDFGANPNLGAVGNLYNRTISGEAAWNGRNKTLDQLAVANVIANRLRMSSQGLGLRGNFAPNDTYQNVMRGFDANGIRVPSKEVDNYNGMPIGKQLSYATTALGSLSPNSVMNTAKTKPSMADASYYRMSPQNLQNVANADHYYDARISDPSWASGLQNKGVFGSHRFGSVDPANVVVARNASPKDQSRITPETAQLRNQVMGGYGQLAYTNFAADPTRIVPGINAPARPAPAVLPASVGKPKAAPSPRSSIYSGYGAPFTVPERVIRVEDVPMATSAQGGLGVVPYNASVASVRPLQVPAGSSTDQRNAFYGGYPTPKAVAETPIPRARPAVQGPQQPSVSLGYGTFNGPTILATPDPNATVENYGGWRQGGSAYNVPAAPNVAPSQDGIPYPPPSRVEKVARHLPFGIGLGVRAGRFFGEREWNKMSDAERKALTEKWAKINATQLSGNTQESRDAKRRPDNSLRYGAGGPQNLADIRPSQDKTTKVDTTWEADALRYGYTASQLKDPEVRALIKQLWEMGFIPKSTTATA